MAELLKEAVPKLRRVAVLYNPAMCTRHIAILLAVKGGRGAGIDLHPVEVAVRRTSSARFAR